jgi:hypothetical protein
MAIELRLLPRAGHYRAPRGEQQSGAMRRPRDCLKALGDVNVPVES